MAQSTPVYYPWMDLKIIEFKISRKKKGWVNQCLSCHIQTPVQGNFSATKRLSRTSETLIYFFFVSLLHVFVLYSATKEENKKFLKKKVAKKSH
jgi:preprotein translocase subunit SecG